MFYDEKINLDIVKCPGVRFDYLSETTYAMSLSYQLSEDNMKNRRKHLPDEAVEDDEFFISMSQQLNWKFEEDKTVSFLEPVHMED